MQPYFRKHMNQRNILQLARGQQLAVILNHNSQGTSYTNPLKSQLKPWCQLIHCAVSLTYNQLASSIQLVVSHIMQHGCCVHVALPQATEDLYSHRYCTSLSNCTDGNLAVAACMGIQCACGTHVKTYHITSQLQLASEFLREKIFTNWPIPTFRDGKVLRSSRTLSHKMFLVVISRVKFSQMVINL